jgi:hypothetical protein
MEKDMVQEGTPRLTLPGGEGSLDPSSRDSSRAASLSNNHCHIAHAGRKTIQGVLSSYAPVNIILSIHFFRSSNITVMPYGATILHASAIIIGAAAG